MSTYLEGSSQLGKIYDVKNGKFADSDSVVNDDDHQLFEFSSTTKTQTLGGVDYVYSENMSYQNLVGSSYQKTESYTMDELYTTTSVSLNLSASYGAFSGELKANYSDSYLSNEAFYAYAEKRLYQLYTLQINASLSDTTNLISLLKTEVQTAIDGIANSDDALNFVTKYGTHFLYKGYYGGRWKYTENISEYYYSTESDMSAKFTANYGGYEGSISASESVDTIQDYSQSDGIFEAKGGDANYLSDGFDAWANSIEDQNKHVLCDFDDNSLQPVSILTTDATIQTLLEDAIDTYLTTSYEMTGFEWDDGDVDSTVVNSSGDEGYLSLDDDTASYQSTVIIGMALHSSNSEMNRVAFKIANLDTNSTSWLTSDGSHFNTSDYEEILELSSGCVATGIGVRVGDGKVKNLTLYYQDIDPVNIDKNNYLSSTVQSATAGSGDNYYHEYAPGNGNDRILIGVSFHVKSKELKGLTVRTSRLQTKSSTISTAPSVSAEAV